MSARDLLGFGRTVVVERGVFGQETFRPEALGFGPVGCIAVVAEWLVGDRHGTAVGGKAGDSARGGGLLVQSPIRRRNDGVRRDFDSVEVCGLFQGAAAEL